MKKSVFLLLLFIGVFADAQVLPVRDQAKLVNELLADRLNNLLPNLMQKAGRGCGSSYPGNTMRTRY